MPISWLHIVFGHLEDPYVSKPWSLMYFIHFAALPQSQHCLRDRLCTAPQTSMQAPKEVSSPPGIAEVRDM